MSRSDELLDRLRVTIEAGLERFAKDQVLDRSYVERIVVPPLKEALESLFSEIDSRHLLDSTKEENRIYVIHYTGIGNLVSMLHRAKENSEDSYLRHYDSVHLNDPDEGNYFNRNLTHSKGHELLPQSKAHHAYIVSFILPQEEKDMSDNLVFWRTYGKEGKGCSLTVPIRRSRLRKVLYGVEDVERSDVILRRVLDKTQEVLHPMISIGNESAGQVKEVLVNTIEGYLEQYRYLFKSDAYDYEQECRLVIPETDVVAKSIRFEYQEDGPDVRIRHYCKDDDLDIRNLIATDSVITLGPRVSNPHNVRYYLNNLLQELNRGGYEIRPSKIPPYRVF